MRKYLEFYINGKWQQPSQTNILEVINPDTEEVAGHVSMGASADVDKAVEAARNAFDGFSQVSRRDRMDLLQSVVSSYKKHSTEIAAAITEEMGAPKWISESSQAASGFLQFKTAIEILESFEFSFKQGTATLYKEAIGVCGFITPWNWPMNQIGCKLAPALATGCTVVWKPSEIAPFSAYLLMQVLDEAGIPKGVVNMINGDGPTVGSAISSHSGIDMVSFTGSTTAGVAVAIDAAPSIKRVTQELGGKSANIILDDLDDTAFAKAISAGVKSMCFNSGQNCNAPSRLFVPEKRKQQAEQIAKHTINKLKVGSPNSDDTFIGPVVSGPQWQRIQHLIQTGIDQGAHLLAGGLGKPEGLEKGYYVKPTIFSEVDNNMQIAKQEIFGPVLCIIPYENDQHAIDMANDSLYGLSSYVSGADQQRVVFISKKLRTGMVHLNGATMDRTVPFGGYRHSGNGRERGQQGFEEFLEIKAVLGA
ncbi:MAG: aldehyde dehydrogenase family protein [Proteobacteria bacterium]|nr:aldehyde dehydrogenase family protein [Pseudomonadota bacterium]